MIQKIINHHKPYNLRHILPKIFSLKNISSTRFTDPKLDLLGFFNIDDHTHLKLNARLTSMDVYHDSAATFM